MKFDALRLMVIKRKHLLTFEEVKQLSWSGRALLCPY